MHNRLLYSSISTCLITFSHDLQVKPAKGKVDNLPQLLTELSTQSLTSQQFKSELFRRTRASEVEIDRALQRLGAIETAEGMRILPAHEIVSMTRLLFNTILAHGLSVRDVSVQQCLDCESQLTVDWLRFLFRFLDAQPLNTNDNSNDNGSNDTNNVNTRWNLNEQRVATAAAHIVFAREQVFL